MAILQECPKCKARSGFERWIKFMEGGETKKRKEPVDTCQCGFKLAKAAGKVYWVEWYINGQRRRERIGPNKSAAEQRLREVLKLRAEERYVDKDPAGRIALGELCTWYLGLPEVKTKDSFRRDHEMIVHVNRLLGEATKIKDITPGKVESYQHQRLAEESPRHPGENVRPATVNKEVACLKTVLNRAVNHRKLNHNPISRVRKIPENNVRMHILAEEEFEKLLSACPVHLQPIVLAGFYMGLRRSEILNLSWPEVDLKKGFIRLSAERTKTDQARAIPIHPRVKAALAALPRGLHTDRVFLMDGKPFNEIKKGFKAACARAGIQDFTFHDLRHCALNNLRLAGNDFFRIMAISGHKTMSCFKRYNLVTEEELSKVKWTSEGGKTSRLDTYMDTKEKGATENVP